MKPLPPGIHRPNCRKIKEYPGGHSTVSVLLGIFDNILFISLLTILGSKQRILCFLCSVSKENSLQRIGCKESKEKYEEKYGEKWVNIIHNLFNGKAWVYRHRIQFIWGGDFVQDVLFLTIFHQNWGYCFEAIWGHLDKTFFCYKLALNWRFIGYQNIFFSTSTQS